ncbi:MAG: methyltransferase domain-containing protein [Betaproteobacteria bacterium]
MQHSQAHLPLVAKDRPLDMANVVPNRQYNLAAPDSLAARVAHWQRRRMYERFVECCAVTKDDSILDVGVTSDRSYASSNYLEAWHPSKERITAAGIDDASFLEAQYPGVRFVHANGLKLPFRDEAFDVVHSSAVLEHVGGASNQAAYIGECIRVARMAVFITTPNRWFPVEFHTSLPFLHWLPKQSYRRALRQLGLGFFAEERNLNLLSRRELERLAPQGSGLDFRVSAVALLGWPSNLLLVGLRDSARRGAASN